MKYLLTGATGHLGRLVLPALIKRVGASAIRAGVHTPAKAADIKRQGVSVVPIDYLDQPSLVAALTGVDVLIYIPSKTYDVLQRVTEFENTLAAMQQTGVERIVFVSFYADQENDPFTMSAYYAYVPRRLAGANVNYTVLKNSLYADPLVPYLPELIARKALIYPVSDQAMSFITQADSAEAIATVAARQDGRDVGQVYTLTQERAWQMAPLGQLMTEVTGKPIGYQPMTVAEFAATYAAEGDGAELGSMYQAGAMGLFDIVTPDFATITGHAPEAMGDFLHRSYSRP